MVSSLAVIFKKNIMTTTIINHHRFPLRFYLIRLPLHNKHRNTFAVFALVEHLLHLVQAVIEVLDFDLPEDFRFRGFFGKIKVIDDARCQKRHKVIENFRVLLLAAEAHDGSDFQRELGHESTILQAVHLQDRLDVVDVPEHDLVLVDTVGPIQDIFRMLLDEGFPVLERRTVEVDVHDPVVRGTLVGAEREDAVLVGNVLPFRVGEIRGY